VNATLKIIEKSETITSIEKIKAELKKRAELKAKRTLLRVQDGWRNADELVDQLVSITCLFKKRLQYPP
jgi:hypothetical protein